MKKLFFIPLLACFACVSAWAVTSVGTQAALQNAINGAAAGSTVELQLSSNITLENQAICIYDRNVIIDLNEHNIETNKDADQIRACFFLLKGTLELKGHGSVVNHNGNMSTNDDWKTVGVNIFGSRTYKTDGTLQDFSHLIVGKDVTVKSDFGKGVQVYTYLNNATYMPSDNTKTVAYFYPLFHSSTSLSNAELNTLKANATYAGPASQHGFAFGVTIDVKGKIEGAQYGVQVSGVITGDHGASNYLNNYPPVRSFTLVNNQYVETFSDNHPLIHVFQNATVQGVGSDPFESGKYPTGVYLAGYGHLVVEGTVSGCNGVFAKAGSITVAGGNVTANGTHVETTDGGGTLASGNAITSTNQTSYAAVSSIFVSGDAHITSQNGYAFEENNVAASGRNEHAANIVVAGGTFEGHTSDPSNEESLKTTNDVKDALTGENPEGKIIAGTFSGDEIVNLVNFAEADRLVTDPIVVASQDGYVINTLPDGSEKKTDVDDLSEVDANDYVSMKNEEQTIIIGENEPEHVRMEYLSMIQDEPTTIIVKDRSVLESGAVVISGASKIIVEAGGKLLITGATGLVAFDVRNLVIQAEPAKAGIFVLSPEVQSNKTPYATVEYYSDAHNKILGTTTLHHFNMFASPFVKIDDIVVENSTPSAYQHIVNGAWTNVTNNKQSVIDEAVAFQGFLVSYNTTDASQKYTFKGQLQGNTDGKFSLKQGFNYIGNGYMGMMDAAALLTALRNSGADVYFGYYTYSALGGYQSHTANQNNLGVLAPMAGIVLYANEDCEVDLDYTSLIWDTNKAE